MKMKMPYVIGGAAFLFVCAVGNGCSRTETQDIGVKLVESSTENHEIKTIEAGIVRVPDMVFSLGEENWASLKAILRRIDEVPDPSARLRLFRSYQDALFSVPFEKAGNIHSKDWKERRFYLRTVKGGYSAVVSRISPPTRLRSAHLADEPAFVESEGRRWQNRP